MKLKPFLPAFFWLVIILIVSGLPSKNLPKAPFNEFDKLVHFLIYGLLSFLIMLGFYKQPNASFSNKIQLFFSLTISIVFGGIVELLQENIFINRYGDWYDFFANTLGAIIGIGFFRFSINKIKKYTTR